MRPHLFAAIAMFMLIAVMAVSNDYQTRGLMIAPVIVLFFAVIAFYGLEYDHFAKAEKRAREPSDGAKA